MAHLLATLGDEPNRTAQFVCAAAFVVPPPVGSAGPDGPVPVSFEHVELGVWPGSVLHAPAGPNGFGYDPIFQPEGVAVSSAELTADEKNAISHRSRAFAAIMPVVRSHLLG